MRKTSIKVIWEVIADHSETIFAFQISSICSFCCEPCHKPIVGSNAMTRTIRSQRINIAKLHKSTIIVCLIFKTGYILLHKYKEKVLLPSVLYPQDKIDR